MASELMRRRIPASHPPTASDPVKKKPSSDELAGAIEAFQDARLYDWEYRRRRLDVAFYRMLADEQGGPIADLGCGTGRIMAGLLRDGHRVVGVDLSAAMLARAAERVRALGARRAARGILLRGDLRALPLRGRFPFIMAAFHTVQHLMTDGELLALLRRVKTLLTPHGWFAFDVFSPQAEWLARPSRRRFDHTVFRHPVTGAKVEYSVSHALDARRRALHMRFHYQPLDERGAKAGRVRIVRLCHRQLDLGTVEALVARAGLRILSRWAGFAGERIDPSNPSATEQHVYLVGAPRNFKANLQTRRRDEPAKTGRGAARRVRDGHPKVTPEGRARRSDTPLRKTPKTPEKPG